jgi:predicted phosphodiesterase
MPTARNRKAYIISDRHCSTPADGEALASEVKGYPSKSGDIIILAGDIVEWWGAAPPEDILPCWSGFSRDILAPLDAAKRHLAACGVRVVLLAGNHDSGGWTGARKAFRQSFGGGTLHVCHGHEYGLFNDVSADGTHIDPRYIIGALVTRMAIGKKPHGPLFSGVDALVRELAHERNLGAALLDYVAARYGKPERFRWTVGGRVVDMAWQHTRDIAAEEFHRWAQWLGYAEIIWRLRADTVSCGWAAARLMDAAPWERHPSPDWGRPSPGVSVFGHTHRPMLGAHSYGIHANCGTTGDIVVVSERGRDMLVEVGRVRPDLPRGYATATAASWSAKGGARREL